MRIGVRLLLIGLLLCAPGALAATPASLVFEPDSGRILQAADAQAPRFPASLTKLMTVYLVLEALKQGRLEPEQSLTISAAAAAQPPVKLGLRQGRTISVEEALLATILKSANDAAVVLAEAVAGDERRFARLMSHKAWALGMRHTAFRNATGLPGPGQVTTASDMGLLAAALLRDFPDAFPLFSRTSFTYLKRRYGTINGWLSRYPGADGIKTGFTCAAGYNLVASAERDGRRLVAVVLGSRSRDARSIRARRLMDQGFAALVAPSDDDASRTRLGRQAWSAPVGTPPRILSAKSCVESGAPARPKVLEAGPFPGWGLIFGWYPDRAAALEEIERKRARLGDLGEAARPAVIGQARAGVVRYSALLVALAEQQSLTACRQLREAGDYCLRLKPEVLNNEGATWR